VKAKRESCPSHLFSLAWNLHQALSTSLPTLHGPTSNTHAWKANDVPSGALAVAIAGGGASTTYRANGASDATAAACYGLSDNAFQLIIHSLDPRFLCRTAIVLAPVREMKSETHPRV